MPWLTLFDNVVNSNAKVMDLGDGHSDKSRLRGWWHTIRSRGGYWMAGGDFHGTRTELLDMYLNGMARRVLERAGGETTWEGLAVEMDLTLDGVTYRRSLLDRANAVRMIYSKIGDNLFTDGSAESGAWASVGTPSTIERVTTWVTKGTFGMHVVTDDAAEGTQIEAGIAITAEKAYQCRVTVEVVTGAWTLAIHRTDNDDVITSVVTDDAGKDVMRVNISDNNEYAGNTYVRLTAAATGAEIYADAAVYQLAPFRAETEWATDDDSISQWGRIEKVLLEGGRSDADATARVQDYLNKRAWPRSVPPDEYEVRDLQGAQDSLSVLFGGYVRTMNWLNLLDGGTAAASAHVTTLVGEAAFVSAGTIETNSLSVQVEEEDPELIWDAIEKIIESGDGSGRWNGGVYGNRRFNYEAAPTTVEYHYRGGLLLEKNEALVEPWRARPGRLVRLDDAPVGPGEITGDEADDPRNTFVIEFKYTAPRKLEFRREN